MKERGQVLQLSAAGAELEVAASVGGDAVRVAVVVGREQCAQAAESCRFDVERCGAVGHSFKVGHGVDRGVPGDTVDVGIEQRAGLRGDGGILDPGVREREHASTRA